MRNKNVNVGLRAWLVVCVFGFGTLSGCQKPVSGFGASEQAATPAIATMAAPQPPARPQRRSDTLAYEHAVTIETSKELLPVRLREIEAACNSDETSQCTVLEVSLQSQQNFPHGNIRMRLAPAGVEPIVALASRDSKMTGRSTHAEDLAEPVADTERQLALLTLHRDRLTQIMKSKDLTIDQIITVSRELATAQSQIDSLNTQHANLRRRIDTELLTIDLSLPVHEYAAEQSPVMDALRSFGSDFREAVGMTVRFLAVLLPWLVIGLPGLFLLRLFWRWIGRVISRREQRA